MLSNLLMGGNVLITTRDLAGQIVHQEKVKNLVVKSGRNQIRDLIMYPDLAGTGYTPDYIAVGSSGTTTTDAMTTMVAEVFRTVITVRESLDSALKFQLFLQPSDANGSGIQDLREIGLFTDAGGGELWARATHAVISKSASISVTYDWTWTLAAS